MYFEKCVILCLYISRRKDVTMFLRTITIKGVTRLYFYESYYENGKTKQRCIENLGRLDELQKLILTSDTKLIQDVKGNYLLIFTSEWNIKWALDKNEGLELAEFNRD